MNDRRNNKTEPKYAYKRYDYKERNMYLRKIKFHKPHRSVFSTTYKTQHIKYNTEISNISNLIPGCVCKCDIFKHIHISSRGVIALYNI